MSPRLEEVEPASEATEEARGPADSVPSAEISLAVIVPTYNRAQLLRRALQSLVDARKPRGLAISCVVVDNNSTDDSARTAMEFKSRYPAVFSYQFEGKQGRCHALNAGIRTSTSDWIAFIDDDEEIDPQWFVLAFPYMVRREVDFFDGPARPRFEVDPPAWLTWGIRRKIGWHEYNEKSDFEYQAGDGRVAIGGNLVIRRSVLDHIGLFDVNLGRTDKGLLAGEDGDMHERLIRSGARGFHLKDMVIHHHVPRARLTKRHCRRQSFDNGITAYVYSRTHPEACTLIGRVPRYLFRRVLWLLPRSLFDFEAQLQLLHVAGYVWGAYGLR